MESKQLERHGYTELVRSVRSAPPPACTFEASTALHAAHADTTQPPAPMSPRRQFSSQATPACGEARQRRRKAAAALSSSSTPIEGRQPALTETHAALEGLPCGF
ncbi:unnamed protein product [Lampetra fluviatilis]